MKKANWMLINGSARRIKPHITVEDMQAKYPDKTISKCKAPPSIPTMEKWVSNGVARAVDGCRGVEPDGTCEHGSPSWIMALGWI